MNFEPNKLTPEESAKIVAKFQKYNEGVIIHEGQYVSYKEKSKTSAKWNQLIDPDYCSLREISSKMKRLATQIHNLIVDDVLGDTSIAFSHKTSRDQIIPFYFTDLYILCRQAILERKATDEYKKDKSELEEILQWEQKNKTVDQILVEKQNRKAELLKKLDDGSTAVESESTTESTTNSPTA